MLEATHFAALDEAAKRHGDHLRLGLLTNQTGLDREGHRTIDILLHSLPEVQFKTLFSPEHGLFGAKGHDQDRRRRPTPRPISPSSASTDAKSTSAAAPDALKDLDAVVIDLQDAGVRFYTYETVVGYFLEAAAQGAHSRSSCSTGPTPSAASQCRAPSPTTGPSPIRTTCRCPSAMA